MNGIDPKWGIALNIVATICALVAAGTIKFVGISPEIIDIIKTTALDVSVVVGVVNSAIGLYSSPRPGPLVSPPAIPFDVNKVAKILLIAFLPLAVVFASLAMGTRAEAGQLHAPAVTGDLKKDLQTDGQNLGLIPPSLQVTPTGNVAKDLQTIWDKIINASTTDLTYASKLAASANTPASAVRKQCWDAIITINNQASGANLKNADGATLAKPDPHAFTDVETLAEVVDNLSPSGPLFTACAGAAQLAKTNVLTFVNAVVTGAAGIAAMPVIPGL